MFLHSLKKNPQIESGQPRSEGLGPVTRIRPGWQDDFMPWWPHSRAPWSENCLPASPPHVRPGGLLRRSQPHGLLLAPRQKLADFLPSLRIMLWPRKGLLLLRGTHSPWGWLASFLQQSILKMGRKGKGRNACCVGYIWCAWHCARA